MLRSILGIICFVGLWITAAGCDSDEKLPTTIIEEPNAAALDAEEARAAAAEAT